MVLPCSLSMCFFCPFSILIALFGGRGRFGWGGVGGASLCLSCICLLAVRALICATFSVPPGVVGWLRLLLMALCGLFYLPF